MVFGASFPSSTKINVKFGPPLTKLSGSVHEGGVCLPTTQSERASMFVAPLYFPAGQFIAADEPPGQLKTYKKLIIRATLCKIY